MATIKLFKNRLTVEIPVKKDVVKADRKTGRKAVTMAIARIKCEIPGAPKTAEIPLGSAWPVKPDMLATGRRAVGAWIEQNVVKGRDYDYLCGKTAAEVGKILFEALHTDKGWYVDLLKQIRGASTKGDAEATDGLWVAAHLEGKWREKIGETNPLLMGFYDTIAKGVFGGIAGAFGGVANALRTSPNPNPGMVAAADTLTLASGGGTAPQQAAATGALVDIRARAAAGDPQAIAAYNNLQRTNQLAAQYQPAAQPQYQAPPPAGAYVLPLRQG